MKSEVQFELHHTRTYTYTHTRAHTHTHARAVGGLVRTVPYSYVHIFEGPVLRNVEDKDGAVSTLVNVH